MKKIGLWLSVILCFIFAFSFVGCESKKDDSKAKSVLISGFSSYKEMQTFNYYNKFGKVEVNTDKNFITEGETSARMEIHGDYKGNRPMMYIWCDTEYFNKNDFSYVKALTLDVFNQNENEVTMIMSFTTRKDNIRKSYGASSFQLKKGINNLIYYIDRQVASYLCDIDSLEFIKFEFQQGKDYESYNLLYLDNLQAHYEYSEVQPLEKTISKTETQDEILYFEDKIDWFNINNLSYQCSSASFPTLSINSDPKYVTQGKKSLKIDVTVNPNEGHPDPWPGMRIEKKYLANYNFASYSDDAYMSFDFLNAGYKTKSLAVNIRDNMDNSLEFAVGFNLKANEWNTIKSMTIGKLKTTNGRHGVPLNVDKIDSITFSYAHEKTGESYSFYMDNLCINK